jgi:hypothetical protein
VAAGGAGSFLPHAQRYEPRFRRVFVLDRQKKKVERGERLITRREDGYLDVQGKDGDDGVHGLVVPPHRAAA